MTIRTASILGIEPGFLEAKWVVLPIFRGDGYGTYQAGHVLVVYVACHNSSESSCREGRKVNALNRVRL